MAEHEEEVRVYKEPSGKAYTRRSNSESDSLSFEGRTFDNFVYTSDVDARRLKHTLDKAKEDDAKRERINSKTIDGLMGKVERFDRDKIGGRFFGYSATGGLTYYTSDIICGLEKQTPTS